MNAAKPLAVQENAALLTRLLDGHHSRTWGAQAFSAVLVPFVAWALSSQVAPSGLIAWLAFHVVVALIRAGSTLAYTRGNKRALSPSAWLIVTTIGLGLSGLAWGNLAFFYNEGVTGPARLLIVLMPMALSAAAVVLMHAAPGVAQWYSAAALGPLIIAMVQDADPLSPVVAGVVLLYAVAVTQIGPVMLGRNLRRVLINVQQLDEAAARAEDAERMAHVGHLAWDHLLSRGQASAEARRILDLAPGEPMKLRTLWQRVPEPERTRVFCLARAAVLAGRPELSFETCLESGPRKLDIQVVQRYEFVPGSGQLARTLTTLADITRLKAAQLELHQLAFRDVLTGLANRALFIQRLTQLIQDADASTPRMAVMMLDLDHFKKVNDSFGHNAGDHLLEQAAERLRQSVRDSDTVARLGGDEFALILPGAPSDAELASRASHIIARLSEPFRVADTEVFVSASVGLALYPQDSDHCDGLMRCADVALFEAKAHGRAGHQFFTEELSRRASERVELEADLRHAIERQELSLAYQPKVQLDNERVVGAEALLRWTHPVRGNVTPDRFIGIAEDTGLIVPIGAWVLRTACEAARDWNFARLHQDGPDAPPLKIAVNLSARQFVNHDILATAGAILTETGCRPEWIELEITESLLFDGRTGVHAALSGLRAMGFTIAIDDFGTGYSALGYLTRFPISTLKIDRSFIHSMCENSDRLGLVNAIISMGKVLRLDLVAEGVETPAQARMLCSMGCQQAQGWHYGRPMPRADFTQRLNLGLATAPSGPQAHAAALSHEATPG